MLQPDCDEVLSGSELTPRLIPKHQSLLNIIFIYHQQLTKTGCFNWVCTIFFWLKFNHLISKHNGNMSISLLNYKVARRNTQQTFQKLRGAGLKNDTTIANNTVRHY